MFGEDVGFERDRRAERQRPMSHPSSTPGMATGSSAANRSTITRPDQTS